MVTSLREDACQKVFTINDLMRVSKKAEYMISNKENASHLAEIAKIETTQKVLKKALVLYRN